MFFFHRRKLQTLLIRFMLFHFRCTKQTLDTCSDCRYMIISNMDDVLDTNSEVRCIYGEKVWEDMADACTDMRVHSEIWYVWCICCGDIARGHAVITRSADAPGKIRGYSTCKKEGPRCVASDQPFGSALESRRFGLFHVFRNICYSISRWGGPIQKSNISCIPPCN